MGTLARNGLKIKFQTCTKKIPWVLIRYIFSWFKLILFITEKRISFDILHSWPKSLCLAIFECFVVPILNVNFPNLFKFKLHNSVKTMKENKRCSFLGEERSFGRWIEFSWERGFEYQKGHPIAQTCLQIWRFFPSFYLKFVKQFIETVIFVRFVSNGN